MAKHSSSWLPRLDADPSATVRFRLMRVAWIAVGLSMTLGAGCTRRGGHRVVDVLPVALVGERSDERDPAQERPVSWPESLMVDDHAGPTLYRDSGPSRGYAWVEAGTALRLRGGVREGRVRAVIDGPLRVRGWIDVDALAGVVSERGRVNGAPIYVVPGDIVSIRSVDGARADISVAARLGHPSLAHTAAFDGSLPLSQLGAGSAGGGAGGTSGETRWIRQSTGLYLNPREDPVFEIPALDPPLPAIALRERGEWVGVRIGIGPYLVGYVRRDAFEAPRPKQDRPVIHSEVLNPWEHQDHSELRIPPGFRIPPPSPPECPEVIPEPPTAHHDTPESVEEEDVLTVPPLPAPPSNLPARLLDARVRSVWEIPRGTQVRVHGTVVAVFDEPGIAVEISRDGQYATVIAAVDDTATVEGEVSTSVLTHRADRATPSADPSAPPSTE